MIGASHVPRRVHLNHAAHAGTELIINKTLTLATQERLMIVLMMMNNATTAVNEKRTRLKQDRSETKLYTSHYANDHTLGCQNSDSANS